MCERLRLNIEDAADELRAATFDSRARASLAPVLSEHFRAHRRRPDTMRPGRGWTHVCGRGDPALVHASGDVVAAGEWPQRRPRPPAVGHDDPLAVGRTMWTQRTTADVALPGSTSIDPVEVSVAVDQHLLLGAVV